MPVTGPPHCLTALNLQVVEVARTMSEEAMQLARQAEDFLATDQDMPEAEKQLALQVQEVRLSLSAALTILSWSMGHTAQSTSCGTGGCRRAILGVLCTL